MRYFFSGRYNMKYMKRSALSVFLMLILAFSLSAQSEKKVLTLEDYPQWKHILSPSISSDSNWVSYTLRPNGGDATVTIKSLSADKVYEIPYASRAMFSEDSRWAAYLIGVSKAETKKLQKEKKPVPTKGELLNLATGAPCWLTPWMLPTREAMVFTC